MTALISFPFRLNGSGSVITRDDADLDYLGEELGALIQTQPGERELVPNYGLNDPAYARFDEAMLSSQVETFGPPVNIESVTTRYLSDTVQDVVVSFSADFTMVTGQAVGEELLADDSDDDLDVTADLDTVEY